MAEFCIGPECLRGGLETIEIDAVADRHGRHDVLLVVVWRRITAYTRGRTRAATYCLPSVAWLPSAVPEPVGHLAAAGDLGVGSATAPVAARSRGQATSQRIDHAPPASLRSRGPATSQRHPAPGGFDRTATGSVARPFSVQPDTVVVP